MLDPIDLPQRLLVRPGTRPRLEDQDADRDFGWDKDSADAVLEKNRCQLEELQHKLYADGRFGLLVVLQGIDAGGKDGTIRDVMTAFNPQGCKVTSFKAPSPEELKHDYLWRVHRHVPARGEIGVFNRSHYEDVLVARVDKLVPKKDWERRYDQINDFERMLGENHVRIVKIFLQVSRDEQKQRLQERLRNPHKRWKFDLADLDKRKQWKQYRKAYEDMLAKCSTVSAPWHVIPADHKWLRNMTVSQILLQELQQLSLRFPKPNYDPAKIRLR